MSVVEQIIGIGFIFGFSLLMCLITEVDLNHFIGFQAFFSVFLIWAGILPLWILVVYILILLFIVMNKSGHIM